MADRGPSKSKTPAVPARPGDEITVYGRFDDPWSNDRAESAAMEEGRWEPSSRSFQAAAAADLQSHDTQAHEVEDFGTFCGQIVYNGNKERKNGSVGRINLITHADAGGADRGPLVALAGRLEPTASDTAVWLGLLKKGESYQDGEKRRVLDMSLLAWLNTDERGLAYRALIRSKLRPDAGLYLYACHGGAGAALLLMTEIARTLNLAVYAFHDPVSYDPRYDSNTHHVMGRGRMFYRDRSEANMKGFKHLDPDTPIPKPAKPYD